MQQTDLLLKRKQTKVTGREIEKHLGLPQGMSSVIETLRILLDPTEVERYSCAIEDLAARKAEEKGLVAA